MSEFQRHHQPHPCQFCGGGAEFKPIDEMERHGIHVYFCQPCHAEYLCFDNGVQGSWSLYTEIADRTYRWTITANEVGQLWRIKIPGVPGTRKNEGMDLIKAFTEDVPELNPHNVNEKLRTWLVFL